MRYDHPNYLIHRELLREPHTGSTITAGAATGGLVGSTMRSHARAVVFGCSAFVGAAGSGGGCKIVVARQQGVGGTVSLTGNTIVDTSLAASALTSLVFTTPLTLESLGDCMFLHGSASAATDITEFSAVVWRYRLLPSTNDNLTNAQLG